MYLVILVLVLVAFLAGLALAVLLARRSLRIRRLVLPRRRDSDPIHIQAFRIHKAKVKRLRRQARRLYDMLRGGHLQPYQHRTLNARQAMFMARRRAEAM